MPASSRARSRGSNSCVASDPNGGTISARLDSGTFGLFDGAYSQPVTPAQSAASRDVRRSECG